MTEISFSLPVTNTNDRNFLSLPGTIIVSQITIIDKEKFFWFPLTNIGDRIFFLVTFDCCQSLTLRFSIH